jgi:two-component system response regulator VicR
MAKILIVEDEKSIADLIELNLSLTGIPAMGSPRRRRVEQTEDWQPDWILLDVMLPGRDGFELISELNRFDIRLSFSRHAIRG